MHTVIYIHGFKSSAQALKATLTKQYIAQHRPDLNFVSINLPHRTKEAYAILAPMVQHELDLGNKVSLIGSSMGGFLAMCLSAHFAVKATLINPCVAPWDLIPSLLGEHINPYTHVSFTVTMQDAEEARQMYDDCSFDLSKLAVYLQRGDEVLPYQRALDLLHNAAVLHVEDGGCHTFDGYANQLPAIIAFLEN